MYLPKSKSSCKTRVDTSRNNLKQSEKLLSNKQLDKFSLFLFLTLFFFISKALAQNPPPGQEAGAQAERIKEHAQQEKERFEEKKAKPPEIEIKKEEKKKPALEAISFTLKEVKVTGVTVFKPEDFPPLYQPYLEKTVTFADLEAIVQKIKNKYKEKGYLTTNVYIPEQEIKEGSVEIRVVEGKMGNLGIEGNKWFSSDLIKRYFHTQKNEILNIRAILKDILRLNQNSDLELKTVISPGKEPQTSDITLKAKDRLPWHIGSGFDNQGTRLTGKLRSSVYFRSTNATGRGDSLFINTLYSSLALGESISYTVPLNTYGTKLGLDLTYVRTKVGKEFKPSEITGITQIYTPHISRELALSEFFSAKADAGINVKCIKKRSEETITANDQLRLPFFGFEIIKRDSNGETNFSPTFNFGTRDFLGSSSRNHPTASRAGTGGFFFKYEQYLRRIQKMPFKSYMVLQSSLQLASHTLPSAEQFQLGGENYIRGYPEGDYLADMGANLRLDWNLSPDWTFPASIIPKSWKLPYSNTPLRNQIEPLLFMDIGGGKLKKVLSDERKNKFLMGIGGGFKLRLYNAVYLKLEWAKRIGGGRPSSGSGPATMHITFQSEI